MPGYTKLFNSILTSTIWCEDVPTRIVWVTMLAKANADGVVESSIPGLAHEARIPIDKTREAIAKFLGPDPDSSDPEFEGRRIEKIRGGWRLLNYQKYRYKYSVEERREYERQRKQQYRQRVRDMSRDVPNVPDVPNCPVKSRKAEAEAEAIPKHLFQKEGVLGGGNRSKNSQIGKNQNPKSQKCMMPGCEHPARAGLPGAAAMFCSEVCFNYAKRLNPENFKVKA